MADLFHRVSIRKYQDRPVEREKIVEILRAAAVGILCNYQKRYTGEIIKGKSVCRDDGECTGGNHICISERL